MNYVSLNKTQLTRRADWSWVIYADSKCNNLAIAIFRNKQIANCICHVDRIWIAFIAFSKVSLLSKADKEMADSVLANSRIKFLKLTRSV